MRRVHQTLSPLEAFLIFQRLPRLAAFEEILAEAVAECAAGEVLAFAEFRRPVGDARRPAEAGNLEHVVLWPQAAGALERGLVPGRRKIDVSGQRQVLAGELLDDD